MRKSQTQKIGDVMREYVDSMRIGHKLKEVEVIHAWESVLGKSIASYTSNIYISKKVLYVHITSSVVKAELMMMREKIRNKLNEKVGFELVKAIEFR